MGSYVGDDKMKKYLYKASFALLFQLASEYDSGPAEGAEFGTCLKKAFVQFTLF